MKATELRAGNLTFFKEKERELNLWDFSTYIQTNIGYYKPIPLTEEWLKRFGFEFWDGLGWRHMETKGLLVFDTFFFYRYYSIGVCLKHVHQLQNLYFALTGEELELKL